MLLKLLYRTIIIYILDFALLKFMGKREIGQLSLFDLVVILIIADISVMGIETEDSPFYMYLLPITGVAILQKFIAYLLIKIPKMRNFLMVSIR